MRTSQLHWAEESRQRSQNTPLVLILSLTASLSGDATQTRSCLPIAFARAQFHGLGNEHLRQKSLFCRTSCRSSWLIQCRQHFSLELRLHVSSFTTRTSNYRFCVHQLR